MTHDEANSIEEVEVKPLYIVHVKGDRGTCSVAFDDPSRALKSVDDLFRHGFNQVRIANAAGQTLLLEDLKILIESKSYAYFSGIEGGGNAPLSGFVVNAVVRFAGFRLGDLRFDLAKAPVSGAAMQTFFKSFFASFSGF